MGPAPSHFHQKFHGKSPWSWVSQLRTTQQAKELIEKAAFLLGVNASEFTVLATMRAARETVRDYGGTVLKTEQHKAFLAALDAVEGTPALHSLMRLHAEINAG
jgi:uncharacterized protein (DUF1778 family)